MDRSRGNKLSPLKKRGKGKKDDSKVLSSSLSFSMIDQLQDQLMDYEKALTSTSGSASSGGGAMSFGMEGFGNDNSDHNPASADDLLDSTLSFIDVQPAVKRNMPKSASAPVLESPAEIYRKRQLRESSDSSWALQQLTGSGSPDDDGSMGPSAMRVTQQPVLPLQFFRVDSSSTGVSTSDNELLQQIATGEIPVPAGQAGRVGAAYHVDPETGEGNWEECIIMGYDRVTEEYSVQWNDGSLSEVSRLGVCPEGQDRLAFATQFKAAQDLRQRAEAMIRYNMYVECMPTDECPEMSMQQANRIQQLAVATLPAEWGDQDTTRLMSEVEVDYVTCMNKIIFDANRENLQNDLPELILPSLDDLVDSTPPPASGVVATAPHNLQEQYNFFVESTSYYTSPFALHALMQVRHMCNQHAALECFYTAHKASLKLEQFKEHQTMANRESNRVLMEWANSVTTTLKTELGRDGDKYVVAESMRPKYTGTALSRLLRRVNLTMSDTLHTITNANLKAYEEFIMHNAAGRVSVNGINDVQTEFDVEGVSKDGDPDAYAYAQRLALAQRPPALFTVTLIVSEEKGVTNQADLDANAKEIKNWWDNEAPKDPDERKKAECPVEPIEAETGHYFTYDTVLDAFVEEVEVAFANVLDELGTIQSVEMLVMDRLYWPQKHCVAGVDPGEKWVVEVRERMVDTVRATLAPLAAYLTQYQEHIEFLNLEVESYLKDLADKIVKLGDDDDDDDEGGKINMNLAAMTKVITKHRKEEERLATTIPQEGINLGLFRVETESMRAMLTTKHRVIVTSLLEKHTEYCDHLAKQLSKSFEKIFIKVGVVPKDIEELSELHEYLVGIPKVLEPLEDDISTLVDWLVVLDDSQWKISVDQSNLNWTVRSWPKKIFEKVQDSFQVLEDRKAKFLSEMEAEQVRFDSVIKALEVEVEEFQKYKDIGAVEQVATHVDAFAAKLAKASEDSMLFNSREGLFDKEFTEYDVLATVKKTFEPYQQLWATTGKWLTDHKTWMTGGFNDLNAEAFEADVDLAFNTISKAAKYFANAGQDECAQIATTIKDQVTKFKPNVPFVVSLRNPGMRDRHWQTLSDELGFQLNPEEQGLSLANVLELDLSDHTELIQKISESAGKEYQIEEAMNNMESAWESINLEIRPYRDSGTSVLGGVDEITAVLDEHITMTQAMNFSAFKKPFEERIESWDKTLFTVSEVLEEWMAVQRSWLYLQPIFESPDINKQLPAEGKRFAQVDKTWRQTMSSAKAHPKAIVFCANEKLLEKLSEGNKLLDMVQKGLSDYLETKRSSFARFYFLSNDELLSILSESKDVKLVQPHLKKCFEGINKVEFEPDLKISALISREKEQVPTVEPVDPVGKNVEHWMSELEQCMLASIHDVMKQAIFDYLVTARPKWMQSWPGMCVINGSQAHWTLEMEKGMNEGGNEGLKHELEKQISQLSDMVVLVRGELEKNARMAIGALTVIDVHARDVTQRMVDQGVDNPADFLWSSQMRYYWLTEDGPGSEIGADLETNKEEGALRCQMVTSRRDYGYEYLGNSFRLVITPLTDKCYLTIMGALQMILGGAPAGPAGTGKTETTKDLAKALAKQCVVFNCGDGLDYLAMGKFFKGLAACGAWACFDEFNRINLEVLSVVGQQIMTIQRAIQTGKPRIIFEESDIKIDPGFGVFITMNPGYAGRSDLPDSLSALFRPVAMMVPDYALIGEIMFFAFGFSVAKLCGAKMVTTFKLCSEQLSSQPHYDYGMRAVKTVITAAGNLKRVDPDMDEEVLLLRALQDVNLPKFLAHDLPLFSGIIMDLFPGKKRPEIDLGALIACIKICTHRKKLQPHPFFLKKTIQLYETICVRHGLMVVGPTGGGKSSNINTLKDALTELKKRKDSGIRYEKVHTYTMNPKSITMGQLYGQFDPNTHEWQDGILVALYRGASMDTKPDLKWVIFDGPVDAIWIENMNTVLDDNKKLCLNSGEMVTMSNQMTMMFEPEDLAVASPATVSRCGMVYMEPKSLGNAPLVTSWLEFHIPPLVPQEVKTKLHLLFDTLLGAAIDMLRRTIKELAPTVDNNLTCSLLRILDCYMAPYAAAEGKPPPAQEKLDDIINFIEPLFVFSLTWSVGATADHHGRSIFNMWLRSEMNHVGCDSLFPKDGQVYDYTWSFEKSKWVKWMDTVTVKPVNSKLDFSEIVVPTMDSVRNTFFLQHLMENGKHVLMVGDTGTGKTVNISQYLGAMPDQFLPITLTFSAQTSCNQVQDTLDGKFEKRRKGIFGPVAGKRFFIYVDDLNMPNKEEYGASPPIEILRQWFDSDGWYDRKLLVFRTIVDCQFVASMGPPGGGRNHITPRFLRHFNIIGYAEMSDESKAGIFEAILNSFLKPFSSDVQAMAKPTVAATIPLYNRVCKELLPTPTKPHYTFNLRDLAKVFQGTLMCSSKSVVDAVQFQRLWCHECKRIYQDRMINDTDKKWFDGLLDEMLKEHFNSALDKVVTSEYLIYGDYMVPGADPKIYDEVEDMAKLKLTCEEYLADYNAESKSPMPLVMFLNAIEHVSRISRVIRQPQGNMLLLGVGGSGRQSLTRMATYMAGYKCFQVEIAKGYGMTEWREDVRQVLLSAGLKDSPVVFLFSDVQIVNEGMLEDINNILNAGDVPNLYGPEEMDSIMNACRVDCQRKKIPPTKLNIFSQYIIRVRKNIHVCLAMSPIGDLFRTRIRMFPSLVNCCTIDWFTEWPAEALDSVANSAMDHAEPGSAVAKVAEDRELVAKMVSVFKAIHLSVARKSVDYWEVLRRRNYVTPTSYLELLNTYKKVLELKSVEVNTQRNRLQTGVDKISETKDMVDGMKKDLEALQPVLAQTQIDVDALMAQIKIDKAEADKTKVTVSAQEKEANAGAAATKAIADDAQRDLDEALPALEAATACLNKLKKADIDEVKSLKTPPGGVKLTAEVMCIMFEIKPVKVNDPDNPGKKIMDYWEASKKNVFVDANKLLHDLVHFDKDNIPDKVIQKIQPYVKMPEFTPKAIEKASKACTALCMWALAMNTYHFVALQVEPKRKMLADAQAELEVTLSQLASAQAELKGVNDRLGELEKGFNEAVAKKEALANQVQQCQVQLSNAGKLIGGLGGEETRWRATTKQLAADLTSLPGDCLVTAGAIGYLGAFTSEFRDELCEAWRAEIERGGIPHTPGCDIISTLSVPVVLRQWQLAGLPTDALSTQNGLIMDKSRRWPLCIDPQGQATSFIKNFGKDTSNCENGMDVVKQSDKNFLRTLENAVRFGKWALMENIGEELDAALEPILLQQTFKQGGQVSMKLGDNTVPYNDSFKFYMTTKLPNPHYAPEVCVKVTLLNFTITMTGLEEQLLVVAVREELPDLAAKKEELTLGNAQMRKELYDIESQILYLLSHSEGNILDDTNLIETLAQAKVTSTEVSAKMEEAEKTEKEIDETSQGYRPVAFRAALLFFSTADLAKVDTMYQYSLPWFTQLFIMGIEKSEKCGDLAQRLTILNEFFTYSVYVNVCRSLFEVHKLLFSFLLCVKILEGDGKINSDEWRFLISGIRPEQRDLENPDPSWIDSQCWAEVLNMSTIPCFDGFEVDFSKKDQLVGWRRVFDSTEPQTCGYPGKWAAKLNSMQKMCILRALRPDKMSEAIQNYVCEYLHPKFIQPPPFDLPATYNDSTCTTPLIFILSSGCDPGKDLITFADSLGFGERFSSIALGQGQGKIAARMIENGRKKGDWALLQNCHLSQSWMPELEVIVESFSVDTVHNDFRLWLTSMPTPFFPVTIMQNSVKMTKEPPKGIRANLKQTYFKLDDDQLGITTKPDIYKHLLFGLSFFHAVMIERKKFGPLGWNIPYAFNDTDFDICKSQLALYLDVYDEVPWAVLKVLTAVVNYGGRITDDKDIRTADIILETFFNPAVLEQGYKFSQSGLYGSVEFNKDAPYKSYWDYIEGLPINPEPEVFGMHDNANITCARAETYSTFQIILSLQPRVASGGGKSREEQIGDSAGNIEKDLPSTYNIPAIQMQYPVRYDESMNTVLVQELQKFNRLLRIVQKTLKDIQLALKGLVVMSGELEQMGTEMFNQLVPSMWMAVSYPSLKPLSAYVIDMLKRLTFMQTWVDEDMPNVYWISCFFFPQAFMTGTLQNYARKTKYPIDECEFAHMFLKEDKDEVAAKPSDGAYMDGLFIEGARWSKIKSGLDDPLPKELFSTMPIIHLSPLKGKTRPTHAIYQTPVYKTLTRAGVLATTGHSSNFVFWMEVPSDRKDCMRQSLCSETNANVLFTDQADWVKGGVACFCALRF